MLFALRIVNSFSPVRRCAIMCMGKARGYVSLRTIRTVIFLIAGKLDYNDINPYVAAL